MIRESDRGVRESSRRSINCCCHTDILRISLRVCLANGDTPLQLALLLNIYTPGKHTKLAARAHVTSRERSRTVPSEKRRSLRRRLLMDGQVIDC